MTKKQLQNLEKLADYLESDSLLANFKMEFYDNVVGDSKSLTDCGTAGCAVGHGPYAGIPKLKNEYWEQYQTRVFGLCDADKIYCFSSSWAAYDNSPKGAAKRIRHILAGGEIEFPWETGDRGW